MPIACSDGEAEPPVEIGRRVEIAHGMNDVIEAARHFQSLRSSSAKAEDPVITSAPIYNERRGLLDARRSLSSGLACADPLAGHDDRERSTPAPAQLSPAPA